MKTTWVILLVGTLLLVQKASGIGVFGIGAEADFSTRYLKRGFVAQDAPVGQGSAWLSVYGIEASVFGNMPLSLKRLDEIDPGLGYRFQAAGLDLDAKAIYYDYPLKDTDNTVEATVSVLYTLGPALAHTYHSVDLMRRAGAYYGNFGLNLALPIIPMLILSPGINVGWASAKFNLANLGPDYGSLLHAGGDLSLILRVIPLLDVRGHTAINFLLPAKVRAVQGKNATNWNLGIGATLQL